MHVRERGGKREGEKDGGDEERLTSEEEGERAAPAGVIGEGDRRRGEEELGHAHMHGLATEIRRRRRRREEEEKLTRAVRAAA